MILFSGELPQYYSRKYEANHPSEIPYRDSQKPSEQKVEPYRHYFPKYTSSTYAPKTYSHYKQQDYQVKTDKSSYQSHASYLKK